MSCSSPNKGKNLLNSSQATDDLYQKHVSMAVEVSMADSKAVSSLSAKRLSPPKPNFDHIVQQNIQDSVLRLSNTFQTIVDPDADTAVYIGAPPALPDQDPREYAALKKHFEQPYLIRSEDLRYMNSEKFNEYLGPKSVRTARKLKKLGVMDSSDPECTRIKFYVDLRPPGEDEEAIILLTSLTCTKGVLSWPRARAFYGISATTVSGSDKFVSGNAMFAPENCPHIFDVHSRDSTTAQMAVTFKPHQDKSPEEVSDHESESTSLTQTARSSHQHNEGKKGLINLDLEPEYSSQRHYSAIERLLQAIHGNDPRLDSAAKVWTFFAIAKYFDCATHPKISTWIYDWIYTVPNSYFIQCNPGIVYQIGLGIQSPDMVRDAFSVLVGEKALINVYSDVYPTILTPLVASVHGRQLDLPDDDEKNRVDHGATSLGYRTRQFWTSLLQDDAAWMHGSPLYRRFLEFEPDNEEEEGLVREFKDLLWNYVRGKMNFMLCQNLKYDCSDFEQNILKVDSFRPGLPHKFFMKYNLLNQPMRMLTRSFWMTLSRTTFELGSSNIDQVGCIGVTDSNIMQSMIQREPEDPINGIKVIPYGALKRVMNLLNNVIQVRIAVSHAAEERERLADFRLRPAYPPEKVGEPDPVLHSRPSHSRENYSTFRLSDDKDDSNDFGHQISVFRPKPSLFTVGVGTDNVTKRLTPGKPNTGGHAHKRRKTLDGENDMTNNQAQPSEHDVGRIENLPIRPRIDPPAESFVSHLTSHEVPNTWSDDVNEDDDENEPTTPTQTTSAQPGSHHRTYPNSFFDYGPAREAALVSSNLNQYDIAVSDDYSSFDQVPPPSPSRHPYIKSGPGPIRPLFPRRPSLEDSRCLSLGSLLTCLSQALASHIDLHILQPQHLYHGSNPAMPTNLIDHLLCLTDDEWKYLPLWAGGNDDGTGGVFEEGWVPNLESGGFKGGRRGVSGSSHALGRTESESDISWDGIRTDEGKSTLGKASRWATDGTHTISSLSSARSSEFDNASISNLGRDHDEMTETGTVLAIQEGIRDLPTRPRVNEPDHEPELEFEFESNGKDQSRDKGKGKVRADESLEHFYDSDGDVHELGPDQDLVGERGVKLDQGKGEALVEEDDDDEMEGSDEEWIDVLSGRDI